MGCDFAFIHCADLHLGSRFWGLSRTDPELGRRMYASTFRSFARIVDAGIEKADFMVIAGDVYDELVETPRTRAAFARELERFGKPVFIVTGNHDAVHSWSASIPYPENVTEFTRPDRIKLTVRGRQVEVVGVSFDGPHTDENLVKKLRGTPGVFTVGVVHCSVDSVGEGGGYAPCSVQDFRGRDVQYWALGHIHKRMTVCEDPPAVYPGNIQGRHVNESGEKGCMLVSVTGNAVETEFIPTQEVLWKDMTLDITGKTSLRELASSARGQADPRTIVSLTVSGKGPLNKVVRNDPGIVADLVGEATGAVVSIRNVLTAPEIDIEAERESGTLLSEVIKTSESLAELSDDEILDMLCSAKHFQDLRPYLEYYAHKCMLKELVREAEMSLLGRLTEAGE